MRVEIDGSHVTASAGKEDEGSHDQQRRSTSILVTPSEVSTHGQGSYAACFPRQTMIHLCHRLSEIDHYYAITVTHFELGRTLKCHHLAFAIIVMAQLVLYLMTKRRTLNT